MNTARVARFPGQAVVPHHAPFLYPGSRSALRAFQMCSDEEPRSGSGTGPSLRKLVRPIGTSDALKHAEVTALEVLRTAEQKLEKAKVGLQRASDADRLDPA